MASHQSYTALITGANSGIGLALTRRLLHEGWTGITLIRSAFADDDAVITRAREQGRLRIYRADLSDEASLKQALDAITAHEQRIDVLFNNAAAALGSIQLSPQGREMHFEVNTVVPYIIARTLQPLIARSSLKTIVNV